MKNKLMLTFTTMALTATMLMMTATAQKGGKKNQLDTHPPTDAKPKVINGPKIDLGTKISLTCKGAAGGDVTSTVRVTNQTGAEIPSLTMVYVQTDNGKAHEALSAPLARRGEAIIHAPKGNTPRSCEAWFFKQ
ncbi:MAG: hypothetical protein HOP19_04365 [Acidobacteria bacterium]|nr:hypothetical protein [Acidobacteriota bacterium]